MTDFAPAPLPNASAIAARAAEGLDRKSTVSACVWSAVYTVAEAQGLGAEYAEGLATMVAGQIRTATGRRD